MVPARAWLAAAMPAAVGVVGREGAKLRVEALPRRRRAETGARA